MFIDKDNNKFFEQINQAFVDQEYYGLNYILDDLYQEELMESVEDTEVDWYGLTDLTIE